MRRDGLGHSGNVIATSIAAVIPSNTKDLGFALEPCVLFRMTSSFRRPAYLINRTANGTRKLTPLEAPIAPITQNTR